MSTPEVWAAILAGVGGLITSGMPGLLAWFKSMENNRLAITAASEALDVAVTNSHAVKELTEIANSNTEAIAEIKVIVKVNQADIETWKSLCLARNGICCGGDKPG